MRLSLTHLSPSIILTNIGHHTVLKSVMFSRVFSVFKKCTCTMSVMFSSECNAKVEVRRNFCVGENERGK